MTKLSFSAPAEDKENATTSSYVLKPVPTIRAFFTPKRSASLQDITPVVKKLDKEKSNTPPPPKEFVRTGVKRLWTTEAEESLAVKRARKYFDVSRETEVSASPFFGRRAGGTEEDTGRDSGLERTLSVDEEPVEMAPQNEISLDEQSLEEAGPMNELSVDEEIEETALEIMSLNEESFQERENENFVSDSTRGVKEAMNDVTDEEVRQVSESPPRMNTKTCISLEEDIILDSPVQSRSARETQFTSRFQTTTSISFYEDEVIPDSPSQSRSIDSIPIPNSSAEDSIPASPTYRRNIFPPSPPQSLPPLTLFRSRQTPINHPGLKRSLYTPSSTPTPQHTQIIQSWKSRFMNHTPLSRPATPLSRPTTPLLKHLPVKQEHIDEVSPPRTGGKPYLDSFRFTAR
jgi:hypothetical protein